MNNLSNALHGVLQSIQNAACDTSRPNVVRLLAVSKTRSADEVKMLAGLGQQAFGENYVQEGVSKQQALASLGLEWHLIGHLQSNKAREAAAAFDWVQSVDRPRIIEVLARHRRADQSPLNVLIQVNIDDEDSKSGCLPEQINALADTIAGHATLRLRGLMAIPSPDPDLSRRRAAFQRMKQLFDALRGHHAGIDTLSMGMSEDFAMAIAEGATLIRVGTALFGARV